MKSAVISLTVLESLVASVLAQTVELANYDTMNTARLVASASKGDAASLEKFCRLSQSVILDGASGEVYSEDLGKIADHAGDSALAATLRKLHLGFRKKDELWNCLQFSHPDLSEKELKKRFPQTSLALGRWLPL